MEDRNLVAGFLDGCFGVNPVGELLTRDLLLCVAILLTSSILSHRYTKSTVQYVHISIGHMTIMQIKMTAIRDLSSKG